MKKILLLMMIIPSIAFSQRKQFYAEVNAGTSTTINYEDEVVDIVDMSVTYEDNVRLNLSLLFGVNIDMGDYSLIDIQVGLHN